LISESITLEYSGAWHKKSIIFKEKKIRTLLQRAPLAARITGM